MNTTNQLSETVINQILSSINLAQLDLSKLSLPGSNRCIVDDDCGSGLGKKQKTLNEQSLEELCPNIKILKDLLERESNRLKLPKKLSIGISGPIGAGKTTMCLEISRLTGWTYYNEKVDTKEINQKLTLFYENKKAHAYELQFLLLGSRYEDYLKISKHTNNCIQDRTIYEDPVFEQVLRDEESINEEQHRNYKGIFNNMVSELKYHDMIIFLDVLPKTSDLRIRMRSRAYESSVAMDYLERLYDEYKNFVKSMSQKTLVLAINWNQFIPIEELYRKHIEPILQNPEVISRPGLIEINPAQSENSP